MFSFTLVPRTDLGATGTRVLTDGRFGSGLRGSDDQVHLRRVSTQPISSRACRRRATGFVPIPAERARRDAPEDRRGMPTTERSEGVGVPDPNRHPEARDDRRFGSTADLSQALAPRRARPRMSFVGLSERTLAASVPGIAPGSEPAFRLTTDPKPSLGTYQLPKRA